MTMQVKEEKVDTEYRQSGQYVAGSTHYPQPPPPIFPAISTFGPQQSTSMMMPNNVQSSKLEETVSENQIDFSSVKGIFGWTSIDGVDVPYIFRKDKMFVSVRIVEQKLLNKYPNSYPDDLGKHQPLTSFFITPHECKLLNEINQVHCGGEFGTKLFSIKDLIVLLSDFVEFYNLVKKTFPENAKMNVDDKNSSCSGSECGWLQVNNTVSPYVKRQTDKFVPLSVMKYAAALNIPGSGVLPETEECDLLNKACKIAGFNFSFSKTTRIISLTEIMKSCKIKIMELPMENPLQHAQYIEMPPSKNNTSQSPEELSPKLEQQNHSKSPGNDIVTNHFHPHMQPSFMDPRMMFSYNRHPFNMYTMQYGPPNVTVNPQQYPTMYNPTMGPPPPYLNGQMTNHQAHGVRNPTPEGRPIHSPVRSPSNGSANTTPLPKSPGRLTSPNQYQPQMRPQLSPGSYPGPPPPSHGIHMPASRPLNGNGPPNHIQPGHNMIYPNPMANFMQQRNQFMEQTVRPNMTNNVSHMRPGMSNTSQVLSQSQHNVGQRPQINPNLRPNSQQNVKTSLSAAVKQPMPPPPSMSGPHQGPMNALQSMVSHHNGNVRDLVQDNPQTVQRNIPNGYNSNLNQNTRPDISNTNQNAPRQNVPAAGRGPSPARKESNKPTTVEGGQGLRRADSVENSSKEQKGQGQEKTINQSLVESIKGVWLGGKSISCMHLNCPGRRGKFCLVEAVCKLYFSGCSVNEFLYALENVLKVPLMTCTDDEEKAFIHYYSLPVTVLKCNKMIDFQDLDKFFPQLSYVFKEKTGNGTTNKTLSQSLEESSNKSPQFPAMPLTVSEMQKQSNKRPNENTNIGGPPAKTSKRLEDTVQRLIHQQEMSSGCGSNEKQGSVIILDD